MNGAFVAFEPTTAGMERLRGHWMEFGDSDLFPGSRFKTSWARFLMKGNRVFDNTGVRRFIESRLGHPSFEDAQLPLAVLATDLDTGAERVFTSGDLIEPLIASGAMPGVYPPVAIDGSLYIDGGVANNVPVTTAVAMGASKIYVIDVSSPNHRRRPLLRPMDYLLHAFSLSRAARLRLDIEHLKDKAEIIMVPVPKLDFVVPFASTEHTPKLIQLAYDLASKSLRGEPTETPEVASPDLPEAAAPTI
jgi:NTE family protein